MNKILADECVHQEIIKSLSQAGFDISSTKEIGLVGVSDDFIFNFAIKKKKILLTFDRGFGDIFRFDIKNSAGIVIVLISQMNKKEIIRNILVFFKSKIAKDLTGKLVIIGKEKIRIKEF